MRTRTVYANLRDRLGFTAVDPDEVHVFCPFCDFEQVLAGPVENYFGFGMLEAWEAVCPACGLWSSGEDEDCNC